ncbi:cellulose binding domain-containing protein [Occallatibacter riparius]|uniref:Cellulose binding domain-containing protein n=1 Tax=Occallatibacter riparius TaxID=1002689 RepID=A0A9J7BVW2_9BACT|nr:cellulose binding domain-containing protein [Occallatibacter riparius]UWZ87011.1 cellulose binding domain-containing protein [Occallatibacter riparius]
MLLGVGFWAAAQTAHFDGAQTASIFGTSSLASSGNIFIGHARNLDGTVAELAPSGTNFGQVNIGEGAPPIPMMFTFDDAGTLGGVSVLTQGASGLDYTDARSGTCTANTSYAAGQTCTVNVSFTPRYPGSRNGAVVLTAPDGSVIATGYVQGTGVGPQVNFNPGTEISIPVAAGSGPLDVAIDGAGNLFVLENGAQTLVEETASDGGYTETTIATGLSDPYQVVVDGAGNLYIADMGNMRVLKETLTASGYVQSTVDSGFGYPYGVAVDASGNVYIADNVADGASNSLVLKETPSTTGYTRSTVVSGLNNPSSVAVDASGNLYIADLNDGSGTLFKETLSNGAYTQTTIPVAEWTEVESIAVDGLGNVFFVDQSTGTIIKETQTSDGYVQRTAVSDLARPWGPWGVAVDQNGNVYTGYPPLDEVVKVDFADAPTLRFTSTRVGTTSADSPQIVTVENNGNAALSFPVPAAGSNPSIGTDFTLGSTGQSDCPLLDSQSASAATLAAAASCELSVSFAPTSSGSLAETLTLTDNNLNTAATQTIALTGTGAIQTTPSITWNAPTAITYGTSLTSAQLNASSTVAGTFSYSPAAGTVLAAGSQTLTVIFTPTDTTDYTTATATVTFTVNRATPSITWNAPAAISYGTVLSSVQLDATGSVPGTVSYSPGAGTVLSAGTQTLTAVLTPTDSADYQTAQASVSLTVNKAAPSITWPAPAAIVYGNALTATQLDASASVAGTFTYSPAAGAVLGAGNQTLTATFNPTDSANYSPVTSTVALTVNKAAAPITWNSPAAITYGTALGSAQLNASSTIAGTFVYSPAAGVIPAAGTQTLTVTFTPTDTTDYTATTSTVMLAVNKATPTITWPTPAPITAGTPLTSTQLDATASVPGAFAYSPAAGTALSVGAQTLNAVFTPTDSVDYNSTTASVVIQVTAVPTFTLSVSSGSLALSAGSNATDTVSVIGQNGFNSAVTLSANGMPSGVTASFGTNPTSGSSVLMFTASTSAMPGTYAITVTGLSGGLSASTIVSLTIQSGFACHVGYSIINSWPGGFQTALTIGNTGTVAISHWILTWTYANGQTVTQLWNGNVSQSGANVTVTNLSYNGSIAPGATYTGAGFNGSWNNKTNAVPTSFAINGTVCH